MKKKIVCLLMGIMVMGLVGCADKTEQAAEPETQTVSEETKDETEETEKLALSELNIEEFVVLNDYKNMTVEASREAVTDEAIEEYINTSILTSYPITDRAVCEGDTVTIDFEGKKDGVAFEGGTSTGYELEIGSHSFIDGFEDGLIGVMPGETVDLDLTFPENYPSEDLAGQAVVFTVTVHNILADTDYENVTVEAMQAMQLTFADKEELWAEGARQLEERYEDAYQQTVANAAIMKALEESTIESVPAYLVEDEVNSYIEYMEMVAPYYLGTDLETYLQSSEGLTMDEYRDILYLEVEEQVKQTMIIQAIANAEGMQATQEEILAAAEEYCTSMGTTVEEAFPDGVDEAEFATYVATQKVLEYLQSNVKVVDALTE